MTMVCFASWILTVVNDQVKLTFFCNQCKYIQRADANVTSLPVAISSLNGSPCLFKPWMHSRTVTKGLHHESGNMPCIVHGKSNNHKHIVSIATSGTIPASQRLQNQIHNVATLANCLNFTIEHIIVEWNPPRERPLLREVCTLRSDPNVSTITFPKSTCAQTPLPEIKRRKKVKFISIRRLDREFFAGCLE